MRRPLSRRALLRGAGGVALGLPFLSAMGCSGRLVGGGDRAPGGGGGGGGGGEGPVTDDGFPLRFLVFFSPEGSVHEEWNCSGGETDFRLSRVLAPLEAHKDRIVVVQGLDHAIAINGSRGDQHTRGMSGILTNTALEGPGDGWASGPSIDQVIAGAIGGDTRFKSLELGVGANDASTWGRMVFRGPSDPIPPENDPYAVFDRLFGDGAGGDEGAAAQRDARRRAVLDAVLDDYRSLEGRLGAADRERLGGHLESLREIESRLDNAGVGATCAPPSLEPIDASQFAIDGRLQTDLLVMALACDQTRVGSLQWSMSNSRVTFDWLGINQIHHDLVHDPWEEIKQQAADVTRWYAEQFAYLLARLRAVPEGNGTLLDHTVILWCSDMSQGFHDLTGMPFVLAGGGGGKLRTGRFLEYDGDPHGELLVALGQMFGLPMETFGDERFGGKALARIL